MLYKIQPALVNKVVGYTVSHRMTEGYQYDGINSVYNLNVRGKLDFTPDIDSIEILKRGKLLDIIESVPVPNSGLLISDKLLKIFLRFPLPLETQVFDAYAVYKEEKHHYNYFYIYESKENLFVDWKKSRFRSRPIGYPRSIGMAFKLDIKKLRDKWNNGERIEPTHPSKLVIYEDKILSDIILFDFSYKGYFVSENVKNEIEKNDCQGVDLMAIDQLGFEVDFV